MVWARCMICVMKIILIRMEVTMIIQWRHQGSATDMHQLAVVGGVRNANGVPGVFGPADGRGQFCMPVFVQIQTKVLLLHFLCVLWCTYNSLLKKQPSALYIGPLKSIVPFWWPICPKNQKIRLNTSSLMRGNAHQFIPPMPNMILIYHIKTN